MSTQTFINLFKHLQERGIALSLSSTKYIYQDTDSVIDDWEELYVPSSTTYEQLKEIMDDALTNGFEFEVRGSTIYVRERQD